MKRALLLLCLPLLLVACGSDSSKGPTHPTGERLSVMTADSGKPQPDPGLSDFKVELPEPSVNVAWAQAGGNAGHAVDNPSLSPAIREIWASSIGSGSSRSFKLLSSPVIGGGAVYAMDSIGRVGAWNLATGDRYWRVDTVPPGRDGEAMGGGLALEGNVLYATTGFGEVLALRAANGGVIWRRSLGKPIRSAPTISEGRLFAITIENETYALEAETGRIIWQHSGIAESAALMGASSPAVQGDTVVVAYSSGELFGLRTQNGRVVWAEVLAVPTAKGALPAIADIRGLPVLDKGQVFAISHSGRFVALGARSGERIWEADLGGFNTPCVSLNAVFTVTNDNQLVALSRDKGQIIWVTDLQKFEDPAEKKGKSVVWSGPVMAGGKLWLTNSLGYLVSYAPETGTVISNQEVAEPFFLPPVVANRTMVLLSDDGRLRAFQ